MSKESYARGFCKAAEAAGVDPTVLAKYAQQVVPGVRPGPNVVNAAAQNAIDAAKNEGVGLLRKYVRPVTPYVHPAVQDEMNRGLAKDTFSHTPQNGAMRIGSLMRSGVVDGKAIARDFVPGYAQKAEQQRRLNNGFRTRIQFGGPLKPGLAYALPYYSGK